MYYIIDFHRSLFVCHVHVLFKRQRLYLVGTEAIVDWHTQHTLFLRNVIFIVHYRLSILFFEIEARLKPLI